MLNYNEIELTVRNAGNIMKSGISSSDIYIKGRADFVTQKDLEVQNYIFTELNKLYPHIGFIGEEEGKSVSNESGMQWILDPIDGTTNYIYGYNMSAISLALKDKDKIVFGIVYNPFTNELFKAVRGEGAYLNDKPIKVSNTDTLTNALVAVGTSPYYKNLAVEVFDKIRHLFEESLDIRRSGSAALDLAYVASGRQDAYFEYNLKPWDYAAGCLILEEAGGIVKDTEGNGLSYTDVIGIVAGCNEKIFNQVLNIVKNSKI